MNETVLIVEDDSDIIEILSLYLCGSDYQVETAANGKLGLELLERKSPSVILVDLMMPEMNGFDFIKEARSVSFERAHHHHFGAQSAHRQDARLGSGCRRVHHEAVRPDRSAGLHSCGSQTLQCIVRKRPKQHFTRRFGRAHGCHRI